MVPLLRGQVLLVAYPAGEVPDELVLLCIPTLATSESGACPGQFVSSCSKMLKHESFPHGQKEVGIQVQSPCQTARRIHKAAFLVKEKVRWLSTLATSRTVSSLDVTFFYHFVWPNFLGEHLPVSSEWKMVERSSAAYGHVRFGLQALVQHVLCLPKSVYKRCMIFLSLCAIRHIARNFAVPNGSIARLPYPALQRVVQYLSSKDAFVLTTASRWDSYAALVDTCAPPKKLLEVASHSPEYLRRMEDLYSSGSLIHAMQRIARKLAKLVNTNDGVYDFSVLVNSELSYHQDKLQNDGALLRIKSFRERAADLHAALAVTDESSTDFQVPGELTDFFQSVAGVVRNEEDDAQTCSKLPVRHAKTWSINFNTLPGPFRDLKRTGYVDSLVEWMGVADVTDHFRVALLFEEAVLEMAMSASALENWPSAFGDAVHTEGWAIKLSIMLETYVSFCSQPSQHRNSLRHSRMVLTVWTLACMQDSLLRNHGEVAFRCLMKDFAPPLAVHALEHLLLPQRRWLELLNRIERYLSPLMSAPHRLLIPGPNGMKDLKALAAATVQRLPFLSAAWEQERLAVEKLEEAHRRQQSYKEDWAGVAQREQQQGVWRQQQARPQFSKESLPRTRLQVGNPAAWVDGQQRLVSGQAEALSNWQAELSSVQNPLPSKVQALPHLCQHEAEAQVIVFCAYIPEQLTRLGTAFCLARHCFDMEAGFPPSPQNPPPFSWRQHVQEFSACHKAAVSLSNYANFELFGDCPPTYRDGKQRESLFLPLKEGLGIHYPDKELHGMKLLWRWQGVLLDPFSEEWPQKGDAPAKLYCTDDLASEEQQLLVSPAENLVLSLMPKPLEDLSKLTYRSLGFLSADLHIRRLLLAMHREELPLQRPLVLAVCKQVLFRAGPRDEPTCFLGRSCKADLEEFESWECTACLKEQARALRIQGGPVNALVCLMTCAGYLAQFDCSKKRPDNAKTARHAFRLCQNLLLSWAGETSKQGQSSARVASMLMAFVQSFRYVPQGRLSIGEAGDAVKLARARIDLENCLAVSNQKLKDDDLAAVEEVCVLHECQLTAPAVLDSILHLFLPSQEPVSEWSIPHLDSAWLSTWREVQTTCGTVLVEPVRGRLLFNGLPVGVLPKEIREHGMFAYIVGQADSPAWVLKNRLFETAPLNSHGGKTFRLCLLPNGELLVQEAGQKSRTLVPSRCLPKGFRRALVTDYCHWVDDEGTSIDFRPASNNTNPRRMYRMLLQDEQTCKLLCSLQGTDFYVVPASEPRVQRLANLFGRVEPDEWVEYLADAFGCLKEVHFLRLDLKFKIGSSQKPGTGEGVFLESLDFPGYCLASKQVLNMLCGFEGFLLLEKMCVMEGLASTSPGLVLLPDGIVKLRNLEHGRASGNPLIRCTMDFPDEERRRKYATFEMHWEDGRMKVKTTVARLQLACLLWAAGTPVPQKLSGRPARTEALELLRQCFQNLPYDEACCLRVRRLLFVVFSFGAVRPAPGRAGLAGAAGASGLCQQGRCWFGHRAQQANIAFARAASFRTHFIPRGSSARLATMAANSKDPEALQLKFVLQELERGAESLLPEP